MLAKGQVVDSKTKEILPQSTVFVTDGEGNVIDNKKKTSGNKEGVFTIDVFPSDFLTISYVGYDNKTVSIKDFSSGTNIIHLEYNKGAESLGGVLNGRVEEETDNGVMQNKPIKWYYWAAFFVIGYYAYTKFKK
jgi:hypothetical protein|tara:strand:- start:2352 stop:2753 length:402 start_codon:yes stop_codon:yes gene_type:complete